MNRQQGRDENSATFLAMIGLLLGSIALIAFSALVIPAILGLVVVVVGFVGFIALHYLLWGRWLSQRPHDDEEEEVE